MKRFFISDTHFEHSGVINLDQRPFGSVAEMREEMIDKWNKRVSPRDEVYILGDFCFSTQTKEWDYLLSALNGKKFLIKGNHDTLSKAKWGEISHHFEKIVDYLEINENGRKIIMAIIRRILLCFMVMSMTLLSMSKS